MFRSIQDFLSVWKYETQSTLKLYQVLNNDVLNVKIYAEGRSILRLAAHINETLTEMTHHAGLNIEENVFEYSSVDELCRHYEKDANLVTDVVAASWADGQLEDKITMYGYEWSKGTTLHLLVTHQAHHRGQLTVLMRQAGLKIPGMYGPSKEEWILYNKEPLR